MPDCRLGRAAMEEKKQPHKPAPAAPDERRPAGQQPLKVRASWLVALIAAGLVAASQCARACDRVHFGAPSEQRIACKCAAPNVAGQCASQLEFEWPPDDAQLLQLLSSRAGARFQLRNVSLVELQAASLDLEHDHEHDDGVERIVLVDVNKRQQRVLGYGGAFTDSSSMLIASKLDARTRAQLMESYFGARGLDYNLARVPIGGTDMSWRAYSYDDLPKELVERGQQDFELAHFRLQPEDLDYKLPLIRQANAIRLRDQRDCAQLERGALRLLASSWSAPNWMKSNHNLVQGGLKDTRDGRYYDAYARYLIRFMDEYERELNRPDDELLAAAGAAKCPRRPFQMWALTPQNEPCTPGRLGLSVVNYNSVNFEPKQMAQFVRYHLVPSLLRANRTARQLALFIWDDTLLGFERYRGELFPTLLEAEDADELYSMRRSISGFNSFDKRLIDDYARGLALHWYSQGLDKLPYKSLYDLRRWLPKRYSIISTEASFIGRPKAGEWAHGEKYARDIIENFRAGSLGWIDWNLALNLAGGPTWSGNFLDAAILVDDQPGAEPPKSRFYKNPMYYAIGHLSRFIKAHSHIVSSQLLVNDQRKRAKQAAQSSKPPPAQLDASKPLSPDEQSRASVQAKAAGWRLVDELEEQTSELLVVASELEAHEGDRQAAATAPLGRPWRQIALVLLNRADRKLAIKLELANCASRVGARPLALELEAKSITSYALNC